MVLRTVSAKRFIILAAVCAAFAVVAPTTPQHAKAAPPPVTVVQGTAARSGNAPGLADASAVGSVTDSLNGPAGTWRLVFRDEFSGTTLDVSNWINCYQWSVDGCTTASNKELEWYQPANVSVSGGALHLTARHESTRGKDGKTYPYSSGMITTGANLVNNTAAKFNYTYGYLQARVKLPAGQGLWPALWLLPSSGAWPPEVDAFENLGNDPERIFMTTHWGAANRWIQGSFSGTDFSAAYHVIGVDWEPSALTWYVDGNVAFRVTDRGAIPAVPMYVLLNLAVGGTWPGDPNTSTRFPATFDVDYVRVWQRS